MPVMKPKPKTPYSLNYTVPVSVRAADQGEPSKPRTFELIAYSGEAMRIWGFGYPVVVDCASLDLSQPMVPALYDHMSYEDAIVGQVTSIEVAQGGVPPITVRGVFTPTGDDRDCSARVLKRADAGYQWQVSIGGEPASVEEFKAGEKVTVNGREYVGPVSVARGVVPREFSFVVLGGDRRTKAVVARRKSLRASAMTWEEWLLSMGFADESALDEVQKANLKILFQEQYPDGGDDDATPPSNAEGETPPVGEDDDETPPANANAKPPRIKGKRFKQGQGQPGRRVAVPLTAKAERKRVAQVRRVCDQYGNPSIVVQGDRVPLAEHAISAGWDRETTEVHAVRNERPRGPNVIVKKSEDSTSLQALQGAFLLRCGGKIDRDFGKHLGAVDLLPSWLRAGINDATRNQIMEAASNLSKQSAVDIARRSLQANGKAVPHDRDDMIRAAFSTGSLGNVLTTSVNAILLASYLDAPDSTVGWCADVDVANYLTQERPRVIKGGNLEPLPEGGEADHDSMSDQVETYKVSRYAKQFVVDEIAIINDNLGAISEKPTDMGQAAQRLRPNLVYATLLANPTLTATGRALFNSTDGNLITSSALAQDKLSAALARMMLVTENGVSLNIMPTHLIVPPTLRDTSRNLIGSDTWVITGNTDVTKGNRNPLFDWNLALVTDPRLENGVTHPLTKTVYAGSTSTWFLASAFAPSIEVGYIRGTGRMPRVRSWVLQDKGQFGQGWDVSHSIGVCVRDWRGIEKMTA